MSKFLFLVESPSKIKTIKKILGSQQYEVMSTLGHIFEIVPKPESIKVDNSFEIEERVIRGRKGILQEILKKAKQSSMIYLAMDGDKEGEGISYSLYKYLVHLNIPIKRLRFYEITPKAIEEALAHPQDIDRFLVEAFNTRRTLDFLLGFGISPLLWSSIAWGLSAGRVQSPSLGLIIDREKKIADFVAEKYWQAEIVCQGGDLELKRVLDTSLDKRLADKEQVEAIEEELSNLDMCIVTDIQISKKKIAAPMPYLTAKLQRDAFSKYKFSLKKTMSIAQSLYDGSASSDHSALITYMRTDSYALSQNFQEEAREYIKNQYSLEYSARYRPRTKAHSQEAHEAIRPADPKITPDIAASILETDALRLYKMIWKKSIESQMQEAQVEVHKITLQDIRGRLELCTSATSLVFPGWKILELPSLSKEEKYLLNLKLGDQVEISRAQLREKFTNPPHALSPAGLVKKLESLGIGRPSTYAYILDVLDKREYIISSKGKIYSSVLGQEVYKFLQKNFQQYIDYHFTAELEQGLDNIALGKIDRVGFLRNFWKQLQDKIKTSVAICPKCRKGRMRLHAQGAKLAKCDNPDCHFVRYLKSNPVRYKEELGVPCPSCKEGSLIKYHMLKTPPVIGCSSYPKCKYIQDNTLPLKCNICGSSIRIIYSHKKGCSLYTCSGYPHCKNILSVCKDICPYCNHDTALDTQKDDLLLCLRCHKHFSHKSLT